ncbi:ATP-binding protein [Streptomyces sp. NBC_00989]|uniref:ATP-binding protein n=1 Tax=Streptomyces sp. NBC_00989 TaxID=2903705 RepID=UPI003862F716|nr:hypothetical protein OG714_44615 [Streptomyces sp. NBC_00989]
MTSLIQDVLLCVPSAGFVAASAVAVRYRGAQANALRQVAALDEEARHLANTRLPALVYTSQNGTGNSASPTGATLHQQLARTETGLAYRSILDQVDAALKAAETRAEASSRAAVQATTSSLQPLVYDIQTAITQLLATEHDATMLARLQPLDHLASQLARRLQILAVITGKWPGRQRDDVPLLDAVRGGVSRIRDYLRVRVPREFPYYVSSRYVEPVVLAVAELLDNAARHSAPRTPVEVTFVDAHQGISIEIHDAGSGMTAEVRAEAARRLSGQHPVQLTKLRTPPAFGHLGVGALARQYGFTVRLDQEHSVHGGIRAVVFVPRTMLAAPPAGDAGPVQERLAHTASAAADSTRADGHGYQVTGDGLALRPPPSRGPRHRAQQLTPPEPPPADSGRALAAFAQGTQTVHTPTHEAPATEEPPR